MNYYLTYLFLLFINKNTFHLCSAEHNEELETEQAVPNPSAEFPSFRAFYDTEAGIPFTLPRVFAKLDPEKFAINESPRNFPKEATEAAVAERKPLLYGEEEDLTDVVLKRQRRHIRGRV